MLKKIVFLLRFITIKKFKSHGSRRKNTKKKLSQVLLHLGKKIIGFRASETIDNSLI